LLIGLGLALLLAVAWLGAPRQDIAELVRYLVFSGVISLAASTIAIGRLQRGRGKLWQQITLVYSIGIAIAIFNVLFTARMMFISADHDLILLVLLLLFAAVVSVSLGYILARTLAQRAIAICMAAQELSDGNLAARVPADGSDELTDLASEFNRMADRLAASDSERKRIEAARRDLIAAISHDLRTPLSSVRAMVEALSDGLVEDPATVQRYLMTMRSQIGHLSSLIDDLFELSQIDAGALRLDLQRVAAGDLVTDAVEALRAQATERDVHLQADIQAGLAQVQCAPQKIERVLYNLISNAVRHTPHGGQVWVKAYPEQSTAHQNRPHGQSVVFEVADTGEGITTEDLPHVFERFYRGEKSRSRATGGAGLGLAIARGIIEAHGGRIWIMSTREQGTQVCFTLPRTTEPRTTEPLNH
jgi:signal transduction histidine kinase